MEPREYEEIIRQLIDLMEEGVYIVDKDGVGLFYSQKMAANEGLTVSDVVGKEYHKVFPGIPLSESTMYMALRKGVAIRKREQTYTNLYGKEITTINSTVPVKVDGQTVAAIEVANDITNIRSMSDTILELQEKKLPARRKPKNPGIPRYTFGDLIGENQAFAEVKRRAERAAGNDASVFIYGETGTGKELFAQSIHYASRRRERPFLAQNCAALPESLLEGILFGTAKGGFTGAIDRAGLFEQASGGTLLLDEISAMPYELQSKLLRVLQESYIRRVGGSTDIPVDVRIIATVNEAPEKLIAEGKLRKDLYYRLNVVSVNIPPLRRRKDDIPLLVDAFLQKHDERFGKEVWMVSESAMSQLMEYDYPGNVRELENIIVQSVSMAENEHVLSERLLQMPLDFNEIGEDVEKWGRRGPLYEHMASVEKEIIREALMDCGGNVTKTAALLQIKRQTLQHKLRKYGLKE